MPLPSLLSQEACEWKHAPLSSHVPTQCVFTLREPPLSPQSPWPPAPSTSTGTMSPTRSRRAALRRAALRAVPCCSLLQPKPARSLSSLAAGNLKIAASCVHSTPRLRPCSPTHPPPQPALQVWQCSTLRRLLIAAQLPLQAGQFRPARLAALQVLEVAGCCYIPAYFAEALCSMQQVRRAGGAAAARGAACSSFCRGMLRLGIGEKAGRLSAAWFLSGLPAPGPACCVALPAPLCPAAAPPGAPRLPAGGHRGGALAGGEARSGSPFCFVLLPQLLPLLLLLLLLCAGRALPRFGLRLCLLAPPVACTLP